MTQRTRTAVTAVTVTLSLAVSGAPLLAAVPGGLPRQAALAPTTPTAAWWEDAGRWLGRHQDARDNGDPTTAEYCWFQASRMVSAARFREDVEESVAGHHLHGLGFPGRWVSDGTLDGTLERLAAVLYGEGDL